MQRRGFRFFGLRFDRADIALRRFFLFARESPLLTTAVPHMHGPKDWRKRARRTAYSKNKSRGPHANGDRGDSGRVPKASMSESVAQQTGEVPVAQVIEEIGISERCARSTCHRGGGRSLISCFYRNAVLPFRSGVERREKECSSLVKRRA